MHRGDEIHLALQQQRQADHGQGKQRQRKDRADGVPTSQHHQPVGRQKQHLRRGGDIGQRRHAQKQRKDHGRQEDSRTGRTTRSPPPSTGICRSLCAKTTPSTAPQASGSPGFKPAADLVEARTPMKGASMRKARDERDQSTTSAPGRDQRPGNHHAAEHIDGREEQTEQRRALEIAQAGAQHVGG